MWRRSWVVVLLLAGCTRDGEDGGFDPNCFSCRADGQRCVFSINCPTGSICNDAVEDLFDPHQPELICRRVVCDSDAECLPPMHCTLENICRAPVCQADQDCASGLACLGGGCEARPSAARAERCVIMTGDQSLLTGASVELNAIALDGEGRVIPLAAFEWSSSDPQIAAISSTIAIAGSREGTAQLTATVGDNPSIDCGPLSITSFAPAPPGVVRVIAVDERTGRPLGDAEITIVAGVSHKATADALGRVETSTGAAVESVTVVKTGWRPISVLSPGTADIFVALSRAEDFTRAGGIRGVVELGETKPADVSTGVVYGARALDLLEYKAVPVADVVETRVGEMVLDMPGNIAIALGEDQFTRDATRCRGVTPASGQLGCFLTRMREGRGAAWVMGGQLKLSEVNAAINKLNEVELDPMYASKDRLRLLVALMPVMNSIWYGAAPYLEIESFEKVRRDPSSRIDCADPVQAFGTGCRADFERYQEVELELVERQAIHTRVIAPVAPALPYAPEDCAGSMAISEYAVLPGRGLILLGLAGAHASLESCRVLGERLPFGPTSANLKDGQLALSSAPLHSGMEGSKRILVISAVSIDNQLTRARDLNLLFERIDRRGTELDLLDRRFIKYPRGVLARTSSSFTFDRTRATTGRRITVESLRGSWTIYAPSSLDTVRFPDIAVLNSIVTGARSGTVQAFESEAQYAELWSLGSRKRIDRSIEHLTGVATTQCGTSPGPCRID